MNTQSEQLNTKETTEVNLIEDGYEDTQGISKLTKLSENFWERKRKEGGGPQSYPCGSSISSLKGKSVLSISVISCCPGWSKLDCFKSSSSCLRFCSCMFRSFVSCLDSRALRLPVECVRVCFQ